MTLNLEVHSQTSIQEWGEYKHLFRYSEIQKVYLGIKKITPSGRQM